MLKFLERNYPYIWFLTMSTLSFIGFLDFEYRQYDRDLLYWKQHFEHCCNELEVFTLTFIGLVIFMKILFVVFVMARNRHTTMNTFDELSQLELKKRYADFLFMRLVVEIDRIEREYDCDLQVMDVRGSMQAHGEMHKAIQNFRKDARKLLTPNEFETTLPLEQVYGILLTEEEAQHWRKTRVNLMDISVDENLIRSLVNPDL